MTELPDLIGKRVLVVEDEPIIGLLLKEFLEDAGIAVTGPAQTVAEGVAMAQTAELDAAVVDASLGGHSSDPVADILVQRGIPIIFATGRPESELRARYSQSVILRKPYRHLDLLAALAKARVS